MKPITGSAALAFTVFLTTVLFASVCFGSPEQSKEQRRAKRQAMIDAIPLIEEGKINQAEKILFDTSVSPKGSADWYYENAMILLKFSVMLKDTGFPDLSTVAGSEAMTQVLSASKEAAKSSDNTMGAKVSTLGGMINEKLLGHRQAAKDWYADAISKDSKSKEASDALGRFDAEQNQVIERLGKKG